ncbi:2Fe-2S iron-sulfur cluster-binding protein [Lignipirellula cremea]|uniref:NADH-quinone oxidoreductase subunit G n=1 Tax=Lignipirellula cremea TaxID=2528010 RepID=A0A518DQU3_9BACT|nr:2Fe-2S iron-sulfur cluster-binding protein [Lignipirellula cremea]QDU94210.1 NADH-quinone oxidoreductase subunit G [Lignipirellula cremea]
MSIVIVNGQEIEVGDDEQLNGIEIAERAGLEVPHYCWHPGMSVVASCRMCLVETGRKNPETGEIQMMPKLSPACQTPATDGSVFVTNSEKVKQARAMVEEDLLIRHPIDCPICDKAGECRLQDYHFEHGQGERRADLKPFTSRRRPLGETVTLFVDRCVMCTRCVRFCREISGTSELMVANRGAHEEIDVFPGFPLNNKMSGNVVDLCPVGALGDKDFLYSQRVWFMQTHDHVCDGCSTGCSIHVDENQDHVYRIRPRENPEVNEWWMCDDGRYGWKHVHSPERLTEPMRQIAAEPGKLQPARLEWSQAPDAIDGALRKAGRLAAVLSPHLTVEEAYLLAKYVRSIDPQAVLAVGPVVQVGEPEKYPNGFTIQAEKCPNRRGVETIVNRLGGELLGWDDFVARLEKETFGGVWVSGGYPSAWIDEATAAKFANVKTLIVQDMFRSPLWEKAHFQLPGAASVEREGSYVNHHQRLQSFGWAIRPPAGVMVEGRLYWRLLQRPGMYNGAQLMGEIAREIVDFAAAAPGVPPNGVDLRVNQLA